MNRTAHRFADHSAITLRGIAVCPCRSLRLRLPFAQQHSREHFETVRCSGPETSAAEPF
ncbi:MAG: hypothetical protein IJI14_17165 [Anaerolineaceae bacterium]|nr:hypothetical protein [Anaerolineaceae bacterium]